VVLVISKELDFSPKIVLMLKRAINRLPPSCKTTFFRVTQCRQHGLPIFAALTDEMCFFVKIQQIRRNKNEENQPLPA
jgi:hypothetical protein